MVFKIASVGIIVAVVNLVLSRLGKDDYSMLTTLAGILVVLVVLLNEIGDLFAMIRTVFNLR